MSNLPPRLSSSSSSSSFLDKKDETSEASTATTATERRAPRPRNSDDDFSAQGDTVTFRRDARYHQQPWYNSAYSNYGTTHDITTLRTRFSSLLAETTKRPNTRNQETIIRSSPNPMELQPLQQLHQTQQQSNNSQSSSSSSSSSSQQNYHDHVVQDASSSSSLCAGLDDDNNNTGHQKPPPPLKQETSSTLVSNTSTDTATLLFVGEEASVSLRLEEKHHDLSHMGQARMGDGCCGNCGDGGSSSWRCCCYCCCFPNHYQSTSEAAAASPTAAPPIEMRPRELQLWRWDNLAVPVCYLVVGLCQGMFRTLLNVYPLALQATEAQQTTLASIATVPAAFKIIYGMVSDNMPWAGGYRRKPYIAVAWTVASSIMLALYWTSDLTLTAQIILSDSDFTLITNTTTTKANGSNRTVELVPTNPAKAPSLAWLSTSFFLFGISLWWADAVMDAVVAEKTKFEPVERRGSLQSTCYACRFFGLMVSAPLSTWTYSHVGPQCIVQGLILVPTIMLPLTYLLHEEPFVTTSSPWRNQAHEIWHTVCCRAVWQPMAFLYLFNLCQVPNAAWRQFLRTVWHFDDAALNTLLTASYVLLYAGTMCYKFCFLHISWRTIYAICILCNGVFSLLQLLLIRGRTLFGLSPFWFALGDDALAEFIQGVQFLPTAILMVALTPAGSEGTAYAMFTTVWNSAMMIAPAIGSSVLLGIWDVSVHAMQAGQLDGLFRLSLLTTSLQLIPPLLILRWMPHDREHLYALNQKAGSGHALGGIVFLTVLGASLIWTLLVAILNIVWPEWAGGS